MEKEKEPARSATGAPICAYRRSNSEYPPDFRAAMSSTILFIHGMFLTPKSWERWVKFFSSRGFRCLAPAWPFHEGEPAELRERVAAGLGELRLAMVFDHFAHLLRDEGAKPILIGHSMGGLVVQHLISRGLGAAGVCISSVAPNAMLSLDWGFFRNSAAIMNPLMGDKPFVMTVEGFHHNFCNTLTAQEAQEAYDAYVVPESRNVLRDSMGRVAHLDLDRPHVPLLFLAGEQDNIIPDELNRKNAEAYTHRESISDFQDFASRGHFICNEPGWQAPASFIEGWLEANVAGHDPIGFALR